MKKSSTRGGWRSSRRSSRVSLKRCWRAFKMNVWLWQRLWRQRPLNLKESLHTHDGSIRNDGTRGTTIQNNSKAHMRHCATALTTIRREAQKAEAAASSLHGLAAAAAEFEGFHPHITHKVYSFLLTASTLPLAVAATSSSVTTLQRSECTHWIVGTSVPPSQIISESTCGRGRRFSHLKKTEVRGRNTPIDLNGGQQRTTGIA